jgi:hypothetical protein
LTPLSNEKIVLFGLVGGLKLSKVRVASIDFSNTSNLIFLYDEGMNDSNLWPCKYGYTDAFCKFPGPTVFVRPSA